MSEPESGADAVRADPENLRLHPDRNKELIRASLEDVGPFRSIAIDGEGIVRAGNGVYEQAQALGLRMRIVDAEPDELIAVRRSDLVGDAAVRAAAYDNRAGETSTWDLEALDALAVTSPELLDGMWTDAEWDATFAVGDEPVDERPTLNLVADETAGQEGGRRGTGERAGEHAEADESRFPLAIILDKDAYRRWGDLKRELGTVSDTRAFLSLLDAAAVVAEEQAGGAIPQELGDSAAHAVG